MAKYRYHIRYRASPRYDEFIYACSHRTEDRQVLLLDEEGAAIAGLSLFNVIWWQRKLVE